ncbi:hypothetical protein [Acetivibrio cellulolyticus]|uniref:hypothetical protein n=1 Tax=Acetivibrio cellulolyticus TaxID=35830 RepID=UPI0001E2FBC8|nr:hypothetical protein [Acetivibrio cellulolyticus]
MKVAKIGVLFIVSAILFLCSCSSNQHDSLNNLGTKYNIENNKTKFGVYLYDSVETLSNDGKESKLNEIPVISENNIKSYNWKTHEIILSNIEKRDIDFQNQLDGGCKTVGGKPNGRFAVLVNGVKKYEGVFPAAAEMSFQAEGETVMRDTAEGVKIELFGMDRKVDPRTQKDIYDVLKSLGKLSE